MEESALYAISRMAMGGMRDAQSILDQMISFCGNTITQQNVFGSLWTCIKRQDNIIGNGIIRGDYGYILKKRMHFPMKDSIFTGLYRI